MMKSRKQYLKEAEQELKKIREGYPVSTENTLPNALNDFKGDFISLSRSLNSIRLVLKDIENGMKRDNPVDKQTAKHFLEVTRLYERQKSEMDRTIATIASEMSDAMTRK